MQQQTMLAMGALLILSTLTVNQQKSIFFMQQGAYVREMESAAADYAKKRLHEITSSAGFDEARLTMTIIDTDTTDLTLPLSIGTDGGENPNDASTFDDVDDFDGFSEDVTHTLSDETYALRATYTVRYLHPVTADTTSNARGLAKQVIADVVTRDSVGYAAARVTFKKTVALSDYVN